MSGPGPGPEAPPDSVQVWGQPWSRRSRTRSGSGADPCFFTAAAPWWRAAVILPGSSPLLSYCLSLSVSSFLRPRREPLSEGRPHGAGPRGPAAGEALLLREPEGQRVYFLLPHRNRLGQHAEVRKLKRAFLSLSLQDFLFCPVSEGGLFQWANKKERLC